MLAARALGARDARVLKYAHSGEISGDYGGVVGYLAAAFGVVRRDADRPCRRRSLLALARDRVRDARG